MKSIELMAINRLKQAIHDGINISIKHETTNGKYYIVAQASCKRNPELKLSILKAEIEDIDQYKEDMINLRANWEIERNRWNSSLAQVDAHKTELDALG